LLLAHANAIANKIVELCLIGLERDGHSKPLLDESFWCPSPLERE
jgi:hypothetical protein